MSRESQGKGEKDFHLKTRLRPVWFEFLGAGKERVLKDTVPRSPSAIFEGNRTRKGKKHGEWLGSWPGGT